MVFVGGGAQQRLAQAGVALKIATGHLHSNHSYGEKEVVQTGRAQKCVLRG